VTGCGKTSPVSSSFAVLGSNSVMYPGSVTVDGDCHPGPAKWVAAVRPLLPARGPRTHSSALLDGRFVGVTRSAAEFAFGAAPYLVHVSAL
jgi:hypothetical protein